MATPGPLLPADEQLTHQIAATFAGAPVIDPRGVYPSDTSLQTLTPTLHGNGFWNSGALDKVERLIASGADTPDGCEVLLNLGAECPPHFERFPRLLEIVSSTDEEKDSGRARYRFYRDRGYKIASHDLAQASE